MEDAPKLTKSEIESALKAYGLQGIGLTVDEKHWHLGNEMGNLRMPMEHLIQSCIDYLKRNNMTIPKPEVEEVTIEPVEVETAKKSTKPTKEKAA